MYLSLAYLQNECTSRSDTVQSLCFPLSQLMDGHLVWPGARHYEIGTKKALIKLSRTSTQDHLDHQKGLTVIRRNKTPPTGAGIRPFLSGLNYHAVEIFDFLWLSRQLSVVFTNGILGIIDRKLITLEKGKNTGIRPLFGQNWRLGGGLIPADYCIIEELSKSDSGLSLSLD